MSNTIKITAGELFLLTSKALEVQRLSMRFGKLIKSETGFLWWKKYEYEPMERDEFNEMMFSQFWPFTELRFINEINEQDEFMEIDIDMSVYGAILSYSKGYK